jgi:hypothetical protein
MIPRLQLATRPTTTTQHKDLLVTLRSFPFFFLLRRQDEKLTSKESTTQNKGVFIFFMGFPQHKRWIWGLDYNGPQIFGFLDFWLFDFFGQ